MIYTADVTYVVHSIHSFIPTALNFAGEWSDTLDEGSGEIDQGGHSFFSDKFKSFQGDF